MPKLEKVHALKVAFMLMDARERAGLSQEEVAAQIGVSTEYYEWIESGAIAATVSQWMAICSVLGIECDFFRYPEAFAHFVSIRESGRNNVIYLPFS